MISNKTKDIYKEKLHKSYKGRKIIINTTLVLLIIYIAMVIITFFVSGLIKNSPLDIYTQDGEAALFGLHLTLYAWIMAGVGIILLIMQIISAVLIHTIISPKTASEMLKQVSAREREQHMKTKIYKEWQAKQQKDKKNSKSKRK